MNVSILLKLVRKWEQEFDKLETTYDKTENTFNKNFLLGGQMGMEKCINDLKELIQSEYSDEEIEKGMK